MIPRTILVLGGSGFVGRHLVAHLADGTREVIVPTRHRERAKQALLMLPTIDLVQADVNDRSVLATLVRRADAVVNLVGVLHDGRGDPYGPGFKAAHVDLPTRLVEACEQAGVTRLLHLSALGVDLHAAHPLPSMYLRSKADGERAIRRARVPWTIFRPSVIFGPDDDFLNAFAALQRRLPVMPLARGGTRFSPVYVRDVAQAIRTAIDEPRTHGRTYELGGPETYTLRELVELAGRWSGHPRRIVALPDALGRLLAWLMQLAPGDPPMSVDNFESLSIDNVASAPFAPELGVASPTPLSGVAPVYLARRPPVIALARARAHR